MCSGIESGPARKQVDLSELFKYKQMIREATLFALSSLSEQLLEKHESGFRTSNLKNMIEQIVAGDFLIDSLEYRFLYARIFTTVAKFSSVQSSTRALS
ncbi:unnamed protein product [Trifolium pratense]|uniref:Uncharacterized protein n=1 Tax=Trifolium pratense TaxID=57577 RepID=A0ACB0KIX4_TRIPR|nr:unnamed protein product [Trifolium pratense]